MEGRKMARKTKQEEPQVSMECLVAVATELNEVFDWADTEDVIKTDDVEISELELDIKDAAKELTPTDELTDETRAILVELGVELPEAAKEEPKAKGKAPAPEKGKAPEKAKGKADDKGKTPPPEKAKGKAPAKAGEPGAPGVIASILEFIQKDGPITKDEILAALAKRFPDRDTDKMKKTVQVQLNGKDTCRMEKEKGVVFTKKDGNFSIKKK